MAFFKCFNDILLNSSVGIWTTLSPTQWHPLFIPGWPVTHIITSPLPLQSRQVFIASSKLSVPQLVTLPTQFSSPWKRVADMRMTQFSMTLRELNMIGLSALEWRYLVKHAQVTSLCYFECQYTQAKVLPSVGLMSALILLSNTVRIYCLESPFQGSRPYVNLICFLARVSSTFLVDSSYRYFSFLSLTKLILSASLSPILVRQLSRPMLPLDSIESNPLMNLTTTMSRMVCQSILKIPQLAAHWVTECIISSIRISTININEAIIIIKNRANPTHLFYCPGYQIRNIPTNIFTLIQILRV